MATPRVSLAHIDRTTEVLQVRWVNDDTLIYTLSDGAEADLWTVKADGDGTTAPQRVTAQGVVAGTPYNRDVDPFDVTPAGDAVMFVSGDRWEGNNIYRMNVSTGVSSQWAAGDRVRTPRVTNDGSEVVFITDLWGIDDVAIASIDGSRVENLTSDSWVNTDPSPSPDPDSTLIAYAANRQQDFTDDHEIRVVNRSSGDVRTIAGGAGDGNAQFPTWSTDGGMLYFASDESGHSDIYRWDVETDAVERLTAGDTEDSDPQVHPTDSALAFTRERDGTVDVAILYVDTGDVDRLTDGAGVAHRARWNDSGKIAYVYSDYRTPARVRTMDDPTDGSIDRTISGTPALHRAAIEPDSVRFRSADGTEIPALLFDPEGGQDGGLVFVHGGPMKAIRRDWRPLLQFFASRGFTTLAPNFRGSLGHGREHRQAVYGDWAGHPLRDTIAAAEYLGDLEHVDPERLGIWGPSYGGYLTLLALSRYPDVFEAGACFYGTPDYEEYYNDHDDFPHEGSYWEQKFSIGIRLMLKHFGPIAANRETYVEQSPIHDVEDIQSPLLVLQGLEDPGVLPSQAESLIERLDRHDKVYEYHSYEGQGHGFTGDAFVDAFSRAAAFFEKYLTKPPEVP